MGKMWQELDEKAKVNYYLSFVCIPLDHCRLLIRRKLKLPRKNMPMRWLPTKAE